MAHNYYVHNLKIVEINRTCTCKFYLYCSQYNDECKKLCTKNVNTVKKRKINK